MLKHIEAKSVNGDTALIKKMSSEAKNYLEAIGFEGMPMISVTDVDSTLRSILFTSGKEKVMLEYKKDTYEEVLRIIFSPMEITFVHDILLMRFNQIAADEKGTVVIYNQ